jgi:glyoxylase-like metal-dependent hydrolase (beta-lactamase superfamily II)
MKIKVESYYHKSSYTWTHLVICQETNSAVLIDPVLDYSTSNSAISTDFIDGILEDIREHKLQLHYVLETHIHADHLTAAAYIKNKLGTKTLIGKDVVKVQETFKKVFNLDESFTPNGLQFNALLSDKEIIKFGNCELMALSTPGHTLDSMSYIVGNNVFIGDTLFSPDYGSARCDFPGGDAEILYVSVQSIYALGGDKKLYLCHDYPGENRAAKAWYLSSEQQNLNIHLKSNTSKKEFVDLRETRDKKLQVPKLLLPSVQINIAAGILPVPEGNGVSYLKIPVNNLSVKT